MPYTFPQRLKNSMKQHNKTKFSQRFEISRCHGLMEEHGCLNHEGCVSEPPLHDLLQIGIGNLRIYLIKYSTILNHWNLMA